MFLKTIGYLFSVLAFTALACGLSVSEPQRADEPARATDESLGLAVPPQADESAAEEGEALFQRMGCSGCHTGASQPAPSLAGVYGAQVTLANGETVTADEAYLRQSILDPHAQIVRGYQAIMPEYSDQLSAAQVEALIAYIRSIR